MEKTLLVNSKHKKSNIAVLIPDKVDVKTKNITKDLKRLSIVLKYQFIRKHIILNMYAASTRASKGMK